MGNLCLEQELPQKELSYSPSLPQFLSSAQSGEISQTGLVGPGTQRRLSQDESEHWPQQQCSPMYSNLQSLLPKLVQGLPGEACLHSEERFGYWLLLANCTTRKFQPIQTQARRGGGTMGQNC